eukprot:2698744-Ditylum_brightwellii.AAC.1
MRKEVVEQKGKEGQRQKKLLEEKDEALVARMEKGYIVEQDKRNSKGKKKRKKETAAADLAATSAVLTPVEEDAEGNMEFMLLGLRQLLCHVIVS